VFEAIDFNAQKPKLLKERAGFMAYMFTDSRNALTSRKQGCAAYSIIGPRVGGDGEAVEFAREVLEGESEIVDWADKAQREKFFKERKQIAESLNPA
jgi:hypothetical protein